MRVLQAADRPWCFGACMLVRSRVSRSTFARPRFFRNQIFSLHKPSKIYNPEHAFYNYTSGRWLYNEDLRLSERRHYFDIDALCEIVASSVDKSTDDITRFAKIAEGGSYRIFEVSFRGGFDAIARLPYPAMIPHKYGIASEVATMQYLRLHDLPIPEIYDWSNDISNPLGSEYMIMEKVAGKELERVWFTMNQDATKKMMEKLVDFESKLFRLRFPASGSLYLKDSLDSSIATVEMLSNGPAGAEDFCIGPSTEYLWYYRERHRLGISSGPWKSTEDVLAAPGQRELAWLMKFGEPRLPREPLYRDFNDNQAVSPQIQIENLQNYLKAAPYMAPEDHSLNLPTLRHPDFSPNNIFISDSGDITGIIDWQHTVILPIFLQAKIPNHFQNYGDDSSEEFQRPTHPEGFESLSEDKKEEELELYRRRQLHYFYLGFTCRNNEPHFRAMAKHNLVLRSQLYEAVDRPWEGDNIFLKALMIQLAAHWPDVVGSNHIDIPFQYPQAEVEECRITHEKQHEADNHMRILRNSIGINIDGWVANDLYEEAKNNDKVLLNNILEFAESEQERKEVIDIWPFQDHEEID